MLRFDNFIKFDKDIGISTQIIKTTKVLSFFQICLLICDMLINVFAESKIHPYLIVIGLYAYNTTNLVLNFYSFL